MKYYSSLKEEGDSDTWYNTDELQEHYAKWTKAQKENTVWVYLHETTKVFKFIETESRLMVAWEELRGREWVV